ncbi:hypothetical protein KIL84_017322 [Mauremys mutica]|uniref:Uncharacterized protein n=1 Tax=Mauremys mutica TaxID=74926 RepID=A0A9D3X5W6_9SAUR|nr:hypothetical protein KIL84_017322 [Mauremys mutica]
MPLGAHKQLAEPCLPQPHPSSSRLASPHKLRIERRCTEKGTGGVLSRWGCGRRKGGVATLCGMVVQCGAPSTLVPTLPRQPQSSSTSSLLIPCSAFIRECSCGHEKEHSSIETAPSYPSDLPHRGSPESYLLYMAANVCFIPMNPAELIQL